MATATLLPLATGSTADIDGSPIEDFINFTAVVDSDLGNCLRVASDTKVARLTQPDPQPGQFYIEFQDTGAIPVDATIDSVKAIMRHRFTGIGTVEPGVGAYVLHFEDAGFTHQDIQVALPPSGSFQTDESPIMATNPKTSAPWTRADLFRTGSSAENTWSVYALINSSTPTDTYEVDYLALEVTYTAAGDTPTISSIDVTEGPVTGDTVITVTGTNFDACSAPEIAIGGTVLPGTVVNDTTMTVTTSAHYDVDMTSVTAVVDVVIRCGGQEVDSLTDAFTWEPVWWDFAVPEGLDLDVEPFHFFGYGFPDLEDLDWLRKQLKFSLIDWRRLLVKYPSFRWWTPSTAPDTHGWYYSTASFGGDVYVVDSSDRPVNPRKWSQIATFATGATGMLGGSPGAACVKDNRLYYAAANYTSSTDLPPIRIAKGGSDYQLATVPKTAAGVVPYTLVSMLADNGTVYVSSLDSGTSSADWSGRVFEFDTNSGQLTALGSTFPNGHVPYALAFHNGKLWCGTHKQTAAGAGRVYWIRPGVDTDWTLDLTLASGNVASMLGFQGQLYIGTTDAAGTRGLVRQRTTAGVWSTVETGSGGTARDGNGYLALGEFENVLYASYWNDDSGATVISKIRKSSDGSSWSTSYTGASGTLRPFIGLTSDDDFLFAIGGGTARTAALVRTPDGTTWTNLTGFLPDTTETFVPVFGVLVR